MRQIITLSKDEKKRKKDFKNKISKRRDKGWGEKDELMERKRQMERMKKKKKVRWRGRRLDYQEVKKKWPQRSREDLVGRDEKRMREDERGADRIKKR